MLNAEACCAAPEWFNKPPGTDHPTPPHQGNCYFNLTPPGVLTRWVALDPVDAEKAACATYGARTSNGARPHDRSSLRGFLQEISDYAAHDRTQKVPIHLQPCDATVHHGWTVHRADPNQSTDRQRRSFAMVFKDVRYQRDEELYCRYEQSLATQHSTMRLNS